jgi:hypothetical protein
MDFYDFTYIGNVIIPSDELIFFRGVGQPPTSYRTSLNQNINSTKINSKSTVNQIIKSLKFKTTNPAGFRVHEVLFPRFIQENDKWKRAHATWLNLASFGSSCSALMALAS